MEIRPVSIDQVALARDGKWTAITGEVGTVAGDLKQIDANLELRFSEPAQLFVIYCHRPGEVDGKGRPLPPYLVGAYHELDHRIVHRLRHVASESYDLAAELERREAQAARDDARRRTDVFGEAAEHLIHAIKKDFGNTAHAFVPAAVPSRTAAARGDGSLGDRQDASREATAGGDASPLEEQLPETDRAAA